MAKRKTKAKLKSKAGRPRKEGVTREPNGRADRAEATRDVIYKAKLARMSQYGLSDKEAVTQEAGSAAGRMYLQGDITSEQYQAALLTGQIWHQYNRTQGMPPMTPQAMDWNKVLGRGGDTPEWLIHASREQKDRLFKAVECYIGANKTRRQMANSVLRAVCIEDTDIRQWPQREMFKAFKHVMTEIALEFADIIQPVEREKNAA